VIVASAVFFAKNHQLASPPTVTPNCSVTASGVSLDRKELATSSAAAAMVWSRPSSGPPSATSGPQPPPG
jgi:hypothetical protein